MSHWRALFKTCRYQDADRILAVHGRRPRNSRWAEPELVPAAVRSLRTPLGELFVAASEAGVVASNFDERIFLQELMTLGYEAVVHGAPSEARAIAQAASKELAGYFAGRVRKFAVAVDLEPALTEFGKAVLSEVASKVPFGETATYAEVGERAGRLRAARAVGNILATCPFAVIVPCHRVVHAVRSPHERGDRDGHFSSRKAWLLRFEEDALAR